MSKKLSELAMAIRNHIDEQLSSSSKVSGHDLTKMFIQKHYNVDKVSHNEFNNVAMKVSNYLNYLFDEGVLNMEELPLSQTTGNIQKKLWWLKNKSEKP